MAQRTRTRTAGGGDGGNGGEGGAGVGGGGNGGGSEYAQTAADGAGGGGGGKAPDAHVAGTVALHAEVVDVPAVFVVALAFTQHSSEFELRSTPPVAGRNGMTAVSAAGSTPVKLLVASVMLVAVLSCPSAQGTTPLSVLLFSCSVPRPASREVLALNAAKFIS